MLSPPFPRTGCSAVCWGGVGAGGHMLLPCPFGTWHSSQGEALLQGCGYLHSMAGQVNASPARRALYQPLKWQPGGVMPVLQLGETPAFLSPICLLTAWGATFLIICRGEPAGSFLPFCPLLSPLPTPAVSKSEPLICLPQCPGWSERIPPSPPTLSAFCCPRYSVMS